MYKMNIYLHICVYLHTHIGLWIKHTRMCILRLVNDEWLIPQGRKATKYFLCIYMFIGSWLYTNKMHANMLQLLDSVGREGMREIYAYIIEDAFRSVLQNFLTCRDLKKMPSKIQSQIHLRYIHNTVLVNVS